MGQYELKKGLTRRKSRKKSQEKNTSTQLVISSEQSYTITTCIIHAPFMNMGRPGTYASELNKMLQINGFPPVKAPADVPSGEVFRIKMDSSPSATASQKSLGTGILGFQEEGFGEIQSLGAEFGIYLPQWPTW